MIRNNEATSISSRQALAVSALRGHFSQFAYSIQNKINGAIDKQTDDISIYRDLDYLPRYCQTIVDMSYEGGINLLYSEFERLEYGSVRFTVGDYILNNLEKFEKIDENKAFLMRFTVQKSLASLDDDLIIPIMCNNKIQIIYMRQDEGWSEDKIVELKRKLTEPNSKDSPRQAFVKKTMRSEFFPDPEMGTLRPHSYHTFKDLHLFEFKGEIECDDIVKLPITALYYDTLDQIFFDEKGQDKSNLKFDDFVILGKAMHTMCDIDQGFSLDFLVKVLSEYHDFDSQNFLTCQIADFIQQQANVELNRGEMSKFFYDRTQRIANIYMNKTDDTIRFNAALANLQGLVENRREQNEVVRLVKEQGEYLTAFKNDSIPQIKAKQFVAENYIVSIKPK